MGISWFWFFGATLLAQFPTFAREVLGGDEHVFILLLTVFSLGIGAGSLLCERLSGRKVEIGLVPFGALGLTVFGVDLFLAARFPAAPGAPMGVLAFLGAAGHWRLMADNLLIGLFGGFYIVPLYALIQTRSEKSHQSRVIAANNILNALFMVVSAVVSMLLLKAGLSVPQLFLAAALFNLVVAVYLVALVPEFLIRFLSWLLVHTVYRLRLENAGRIPDEGPALLVSNVLSYVDVLVILAASPRPIFFVIDPSQFRKPVLGWILRLMKAIPAGTATGPGRRCSAPWTQATWWRCSPRAGPRADGHLGAFEAPAGDSWPRSRRRSCPVGAGRAAEQPVLPGSRRPPHRRPPGPRVPAGRRPAGAPGGARRPAGGDGSPPVAPWPERCPSQAGHPGEGQPQASSARISRQW